jgi:hypothetical protein
MPSTVHVAPPGATVKPNDIWSTSPRLIVSTCRAAHDGGVFDMKRPRLSSLTSSVFAFVRPSTSSGL